MDLSIWTGVLLLSGAVGANLIIDRDPADEEEHDQPQPAPVTYGAATVGQPVPDMAAHRDTLAWFLSGEDGPGALPAATAEEDAPLAPPQDAPQDDLVIPLDGTTGLPIIEGFTPGGHLLELVYTPALDPMTGAALQPTLSILPTKDGSGSIISLDGTEVAELPGVTSLSVDNISLLPEQTMTAQTMPAQTRAQAAA